MGEIEIVKVHDADSLTLSVPGCLTSFEFQKKGVTPGKLMLLLVGMALVPKAGGTVVVAPQVPDVLLT